MRTPYGPRRKNRLTTRNLRLAVDALEDRSLPTTIWADSTVPAIASVTDHGPIELGVKFRSDEPGYVTGVRFYKGAGNTGFHVGHIWTADGTLLGTATFTAETGAGWQEAEFDSPIAVAANTTYVASYYAPAGGYAFSGSYFTPTGVDNPPLHALADGTDGANGLFRYGPDGFPSDSNHGGNYWVDLQFSTSPADTTPPRAVPQSPTAGATGVGLQPVVSATFSESIDPSSLTFTLVDPTGFVIPATVTYDDPTRTAVLTPTSPLVAMTSYTATVSAADLAGNVMAAPLTWSFTTGDPARLGQWSAPVDWPLVAINTVLLDNGKVLMWDGGGDCIGSPSARVWDPATGEFTAVPVDTRNDTNDIFCTGMAALPDGRILVVGGHDCSAVGVGTKRINIFDPATGEWTAGPDMTYARWYPTVTALPDGKVLVTGGSDAANAAYDRLPEVYDPSTNTWTVLKTAGAYIPAYPFIYVLPDGRVLEAGSTEYDASAANPVPTRVLDRETGTWTTVQASQVDGGSSVMYLPGKVMKSGSAYEASTPTNTPASAATYVLDMTADDPAWVQTAPMNYGRAYHNLTILPDGTVLATGGSSIVNANKLAPAVHAAEVWDPTTQAWTTLADEQVPRVYHSTALLLPDGRVLVAGGGRNFGQEEANELSAELYSPPYLFHGPRPTVSGAPSAILFDSEFTIQTPDADSIRSVALVRTGADTHSFNEDQRYVPLTFRPTTGGLVVDAPADGNTAPPGDYMLFIVNAAGVPSVAPIVRLTSPTVTSTSPAFGATGVDPAAPKITIGFSEPVDPATISQATVGLFDPSGTPVPATVSYDPATNSAVVAPSKTLDPSTTYTILVRGDASGPRVTNLAGDPLAANFTSYFQTVEQFDTGTYSLWSDADTPASASTNDHNAASLGMKFRTDVPGYVTGMRFYKGAGNTGTHVGHLWDATGNLLATATFTDETATGWQTVTFARPVAIQANTTYVASYYAPNGGYAVDTAYFTAGVDSGPLHGLARGYGQGWVSASNTFPTDGPNGLFRYGADGYPTDSNNASNYWVDVLFTNVAGPTVTGFSPSSGATGVSAGTQVTATFSEPVDPASILFGLKDSAGNQVPASVAYDSTSRTATLTPVAALQSRTTYTATVRDAVNPAGFPQAVPVSWSFTTQRVQLPTVALDFNTTLSPTAPGYTGVKPVVYSAAAHLGWQSLRGIRAVNRAITNPLTRDFHTGTDGTFLVDVPNGTYDVSVGLGDASALRDLVSVWAEGQLLAANVTTRSGQFLEVRGRVTVADGQFTLRVADGGGKNSKFALDKLVLTPDDPDATNLWPATATPAGSGSLGTSGAELGLRFQADTAGYVTGIRFYRLAGNTGTHTGSLWAADGTRLATATFTNETASGWQQVNFSTPVAVQANTTYVASYFAPTGRYSRSLDYFDVSGLTSGHLIVLPASKGGGGVYNRGAGFPSHTNRSSNYLVDVVFAKEWLQSSVADFGTGTVSGTTVTATGDGGVALAHLRDDFSGPALDLTKWSVTSWTSPGGGTTNVTVSGGVLTILGGALTSARPAAGAAVEALVSFAREPGQNFGLATGLSTVAGNSWALFSTWGTSDTLFARVNVVGTESCVSLGAIPPGFHTYRVAPVPGGYAFSIDGTVVATVTGAIPVPEQLSAVVSDSHGVADLPLLIDSITIFAPPDGTFLSTVFDGGAPGITWGSVNWTATILAGTGLAVETRTTDDPNAGWSAWAAVSNGGTVASPAGRYIQYRVLFTTSDTQVTPELLDLSIAWI